MRTGSILTPASLIRTVVLPVLFAAWAARKRTGFVLCKTSGAEASEGLTANPSPSFRVVAALRPRGAQANGGAC